MAERAGFAPSSKASEATAQIIVDHEPSSISSGIVRCAMSTDVGDSAAIAGLEREFGRLLTKPSGLGAPADSRSARMKATAHAQQWRRARSSRALLDSTQWLLRVVKDHTECVTATRSQTADAVSKVDTVDAPGSLDGTVADREDHTVCYVVALNSL